MYSNTGVINSPRWPRDYPSFQNCYWRIEVGRGKGIKIAFMDLDLENDCSDDKVKVKGDRVIFLNVKLWGRLLTTIHVKLIFAGCMKSC